MTDAMGRPLRHRPGRGQRVRARGAGASEVVGTPSKRGGAAAATGGPPAADAIAALDTVVAADTHAAEEAAFAKRSQSAQ